MHSINLRTSQKCILLFCGTFALYFKCIYYDFVNYDDNIFVTANQMVLEGLSAHNIKLAFTNVYGLYIPITWVSLMLDSSIFGSSKAMGFHLTNVLLHSVNASLAYYMLLRLTKRNSLSFFAALLFAIHPLSVESVAWISERKGLAASLFFFLTIISYLNYTIKPTPLRYGSVILIYIFGLLCKPVAITIPFLFLLIDYYENRHANSATTATPTSISTSWRKLLIEKIPFIAIAYIIVNVNMIAELNSGSINPDWYKQLLSRSENAAINYFDYFISTIYPLKLSAFYPVNTDYAAIKLLAAFTLALTLITICYKTNNRQLMFGFIWWIIILLPVSGIIQVGAHQRADRYTYLPNIGLFLAVLAAFPQLPILSKYKRFGISFIAIICLLITSNQIVVWKDSVNLFSNSLDNTKNNHIALNNLAWVYATSKTYASDKSYQILSVDYAEKACVITEYKNPNIVDTLAVCYTNSGEKQKAIELLQNYLTLNKKNNKSETLNYLKTRLDEIRAQK